LASAQTALFFNSGGGIPIGVLIAARASSRTDSATARHLAGPANTVQIAIGIHPCQSLSSAQSATGKILGVQRHDNVAWPVIAAASTATRFRPADTAVLATTGLGGPRLWPCGAQQGDLCGPVLALGAQA